MDSVFRFVSLTASICGATLALVASGTAGANAQQVITDPTSSYSVGIGQNGELYDFYSGIGFRRLADAYDPLAPGSPRDSWGVGIPTLGSAAYADQADYGASNITGTTFNIGTSSATASTTTSIGLEVYQKYSFVSSNILEVKETITNVSGSLEPVVFGRDIDWDVYPTEFDENTFGPTGVSAKVIDSSYYGFENPSPLVPYAASCFGGCNGTADLGGGIQVSLGVLGAGASTSINYYYGISEIGQNVNGLISEAQADGAQYIIATQSSENGAYANLGENSAFIAVGSGVPEPSTWAMMLLGFAGLAFAGYRGSRKSAASAA
jgi:hypothetical protein